MGTVCYALGVFLEKARSGNQATLTVHLHPEIKLSDITPVAHRHEPHHQLLARNH